MKWSYHLGASAPIIGDDNVWSEIPFPLRGLLPHQSAQPWRPRWSCDDMNRMMCDAVVYWGLKRSNKKNQMPRHKQAMAAAPG